MGGERGWALISVLGVLVVLSVIAVGLVTLSATARRISLTARNDVEAGAIMEAAVARAIAGLLDPRVEQRWRVDNVTRRFTFDQIDTDVSIQDQLGLIDLNATDGDTLARLLVNVGGLAQDEAAALADKIMDWREADDLHHLHGATKADYLAAGKAYAPREGPFQSIEELKFVLDMNDAVYARIAPALTVYSKRPTFDPETAPREALLALGGLDEARVGAMLAARASAMLTTQGPSVFARPGVIDPAIPLGGRAFAITVTFTHKGRARVGHATIMLTGDLKRPYLGLVWHLD